MPCERSSFLLLPEDEGSLRWSVTGGRPPVEAPKLTCCVLSISPPAQLSSFGGGSHHLISSTGGTSRPRGQGLSVLLTEGVHFTALPPSWLISIAHMGIGTLDVIVSYRPHNASSPSPTPPWSLQGPPGRHYLSIPQLQVHTLSRSNMQCCESFSSFERQRKVSQVIFVSPPQIFLPLRVQEVIVLSPPPEATSYFVLFCPDGSRR